MSDADDVHHELERLLRTRNRAIRKAFRHIDKERKGRLDAGAFREFLKSIGVEVCDDVVYRKVIKRFGIQQGQPLSYRTFLRIFGYEVDGTTHKDVLAAHARESGTFATSSESGKKKGRPGKNPHWGPKQVLSVVQQKMATQFSSVRKAFRFADADKSGHLDYEEFRQVLRHYNIEMYDADFQKLMRTIDPDGSGEVTYNEFLKVVGGSIAGGTDTGGLAAQLQNKQLDTIMAIGGDSTKSAGKPGVNPTWTATKLEETLANQLALSSKSVRGAFRKFDADSSGSLDYNEFRGVLRRYNIEMSDKNYMDVMHKFDPDGSGHIDYREFLERFGKNIAGHADTGGLSAALQEGNTGLKLSSGPKRVIKAKIPDWSVKQIEKLLSEKIADKGGSVRNAFQRYDEDRTGELTYPEMRRVFGSLNIEMSDKNFATIMKKIDTTGDGCVDYHEFIDYFGGHIAGHADTEGLAAHLQNKQDEVAIPFGGEKGAGKPGVNPTWTATKLEETLANQLALSSKSVRGAFRKFDADSSGSLDYNEFRGVLRRYNIEMSDKNYMDVMHKFDPDGSGHIDYREFLERFGKNIAGHADTGGLSAALQEGNTGLDVGKDAARREKFKLLAGKPAKNPRWTAKQLKKRLEDALSVSEKSVVGAFLKFDADRSGALDFDEMRMVLRKFNIEMDDDNFLQIMYEMDPDGSGCFDYNEFLHHFGEGIAGAADTQGLANQLQDLQNTKRTATGLPMIESKSGGKPGVNPHWTWKQLKQVLSDQLALHSKSVRGAFRRFDEDKSGSLDHDELRCVLRTMNIEMTDDNFLEVMEYFDPDGSGHIDYREFAQHFGSGISGAADGPDGLSNKLMDADARRAAEAANTTINFGKDTGSKGRPGENPHWTAKQVKHAIENHIALASKSALKAFKRFDTDHSGTLDYDEFRQVLRRYNIEMSDENYLDVMKVFDPDGGGSLDYNEFLVQFGSAIAGGTDGPSGISAKLQHGDEIEDRHGKSGPARPAWSFVTAGGDSSLMGSIGANAAPPGGFKPKLPRWRPADVKRVLGQKLGDKYTSTTQAFRYLDEDKSGHLDLHEFRMLMATFNIEMDDADFANLCKSLRIASSGMPFTEFMHLFGGSISGQADSGWIQGTTAHSYFTKKRAGAGSGPPSEACTDPGVYDDLSSLAPSTARSVISARPSSARARPSSSGGSRVAQRLESAQRQASKYGVTNGSTMPPRSTNRATIPLTSENIEAFTKANAEDESDVVKIDGRRYDVETGGLNTTAASKMMVGSLRSALKVLNADRRKENGDLGVVKEAKRKKAQRSKTRPASAGASSSRRRKRSINTVTFLERKAKAAAEAKNAKTNYCTPLKKPTHRSGRVFRMDDPRYNPPKKRSSASKHLYMLMTVQSLRQRLKNRNKFHQCAKALSTAAANSNGNLDEQAFRRTLRSAAIELDDLSFTTLVSSVGKDFRGFVDWRKFLRRYHDARLHGPCAVMNATGSSTGLLDFSGTSYGKLGDAGGIAATTSSGNALRKAESAPSMSAFILRDTKPSHHQESGGRSTTTGNAIYRSAGHNEENDANGANSNPAPSPEQPDLTFITSIKGAEEFAKKRSMSQMERATIGYGSRGYQKIQGAKARPGSAVQSRRSTKNLHDRIQSRTTGQSGVSGGWDGARPTTS